MSLHKRFPALAQLADLPCEDAKTVRLDLSKTPLQVAAPERSPRQYDMMETPSDHQGTTRVDLSGLARFARDCKGSEGYADAIIERLGPEQGSQAPSPSHDGARREGPTVLIDGEVPNRDSLPVDVPTETGERPVAQASPLREDPKQRTVTAVHRRIRNSRRAASDRPDRWQAAWWGILGFGCGFGAALVLQPYLDGPWGRQFVAFVQRIWAG